MPTSVPGSSRGTGRGARGGVPPSAAAEPGSGLGPTAGDRAPAADSGRGPNATAWRGGRAARGFTLIELLVVIAIVAVATAVMSLALRDPHAARLEEEGERLATLLEMARAEARVSGLTVRWWPTPAEQGVDPALQFRFGGLATAGQALPTRWLDPATRAEVVGAPAVLLGPEPILPPQRVVLTLAGQRIELASDGLGPFAVAGPAVAAAR